MDARDKEEAHNIIKVKMVEESECGEDARTMGSRAELARTGTINSCARGICSGELRCRIRGNVRERVWSMEEGS